MTAYSSIYTDYMSAGLDADKPSSLNIAPGALGFYYSTDTKTLSIWNGSGWDATGSGGVTSVTAGTGLNVGAGPGGSITTSGTLNLKPATNAALGGVIVNTSAGLAVSSGTVSNTGILSLVGGTGITISNGNTVVNAGINSLVAGSNVTITSGNTISVPTTTQSSFVLCSIGLATGATLGALA